MENTIEIRLDPRTIQTLLSSIDQIRLSGWQIDELRVAPPNEDVQSWTPLYQVEMRLWDQGRKLKSCVQDLKMKVPEGFKHYLDCPNGVLLLDERSGGVMLFEC